MKKVNILIGLLSVLVVFAVVASLQGGVQCRHSVDDCVAAFVYLRAGG